MSQPAHLRESELGSRLAILIVMPKRLPVHAHPTPLPAIHRDDPIQCPPRYVRGHFALRSSSPPDAKAANQLANVREGAGAGASFAGLIAFPVEYCNAMRAARPSFRRGPHISLSPFKVRNRDIAEHRPIVGRAAEGA